MTAKKINELSAKTPVSTDVIPVADPATGIAGKSTAQQVYDASISAALSISYTGTAPPINSFLIAPKMSTQSGGVITVSSGISIKYLYIKYLNSSSISFLNLVGTDDSFQIIDAPFLTSLSLPNLAYVGLNFRPQLLPFLTTLSLPSLKHVGGTFNPDALNALTNISIPSLEFVGGTFDLNSNLLTSVSLPALSCVNATVFLTSMANLTTVSLPVLSFAHSIGVSTLASLTELSFPSLSVSASTFSISIMPSLTTLSAPLLGYIGGSLFLSQMASLTTISFPSLKDVAVNAAKTNLNFGNIVIQSMALLTSVSFSAIETIGSSSSISINLISGTAALTTFTLGSTLRLVNGNVIMTSCALTQASVDGLLVRLAALDGTGVTTAYNTKTVTITGTSATPSATGLAAKATLVARGCTVTHN